MGAFTSKDDRVIGDIIKKLPGIETQGSQILYQGKPIQKYSIDGLDLLEGRYSMANENMPADAVQTVQVVENNQPIKILDSLVFSDRASLNIKLKKFTNTGSGKIGVGAKPLLWDVNLTPMTFNKTFQTINSYQTNNLGDDVARQLETYISGNSFDADIPDNVIAAAKNFLSLHGIITPPFSQKRWLRNNIHLLNSNVLQKLKNDVELKGNFSFVNDYRQLASSARSKIFTENQTIELKEDLGNDFNINDLRGNISFIKNEKDIYLRNKVSFGKRWNSDVGNVVRNDRTNIHQQKNLDNYYIANKLSAAKFLGKQLVNISSYVYYAETPQSLSITPGQFQSILNADKTYEKVKQSLLFKNFDTDNYLSFAKSFKGITFMPKLGIAFNRNHLQSDITVFETAEQSQSDNRFANDLTLTLTRPYAELGAQYRTKRWRMSATLPLTWQLYSIENKITNEPIRTQDYMAVNPSGYAIYRINDNWESTLSSGYSNSFGDISQMYTAYLLTSYRNIQRFNASIPRSIRFLNSLSFNFKNSLKANFVNIGMRSTTGSNDFTYQTVIDENGLNTINLVPQKSHQSGVNLSGDISRYFIKMKTTAKLRAAVGFSQSEQILNNLQNTVHTQNISGGIEINNTFLDYMIISYNGSISHFQNKINTRHLSQAHTQRHQLNISFYPVDNHTVSLNTEYYYNSLQTRSNQVFMDAVYRYSIPKKKIDIELACNNLFNNKTFFSIHNYDYTIVENTFDMRPTQGVVSVKFRF